ncbi:MAG: hypothetical protein REV35_00945 [Burkholderia sp.]|nr:hypothetical protein [Burkholderia sp.]
MRPLKWPIKATRLNQQEVIRKILKDVNLAVSEVRLSAEITGREKTICSIYRKMREKKLSFSSILDLYGFRIIVESSLDCYICIDALHALYNPVSGKFKDYIAIPKTNGYQSLHTTLIGPFGLPIEFQVRTRKMNEIAEAGMAAHWLYKNGSIGI